MSHPKTVHTIRQGINTKVFHSKERETSRSCVISKFAQLKTLDPLLLWVGRMVDLKRLDVLIEAVALMRQKGHSATLAMVGDGPERATIERLVAERKLTDHVVFVGATSPESLGVWYRAADVTVLASESEGLPNVLRESLACGTPFVSTDVGSITEIADDRYSELVPVHDHVALAGGIIKVIEGEHRQHAAQYVPRSWSEMAEDLIALFQSCHKTGDQNGQVSEVTCHAY